MPFHFIKPRTDKSFITFMESYGFRQVTCSVTDMWLLQRGFKYPVYTDDRFRVYAKRLGSRMNPVMDCILCDGKVAYESKLISAKLKDLFPLLKPYS